MNKEFNRMLKLAGLMTEGLYTNQMTSEEPVIEAPMSRMTRGSLKKKIKEMMTLMPDGDTGEMVGEGRMYFHVLEDGGYGNIGHQGVYHTEEEAQNRANKLVDMFPDSSFYVEASNSEKEPYNVTVEAETLGEKAYGEMSSLGEDHTMVAYQMAKELIKQVPEAALANKELFLTMVKALQDELYDSAADRFGNAGSAPDEVGGIEENASDIPSSISKSSVELLISAAKRIIGALKDGGFEQEDIYDYIMDKVKTLSVDEALFEAKKEEEEAPEEVNIDVEAPVEDTADTTVDINMDGTPDLDTGSPEFKKAFTTLIDAYNAAKEIGDPKYTQMLANAVTYFNKNMILKPGQP